MKIFFLGTAAAEGYPAPFCECEHCREARKEGGKSLRLRSSLFIDHELLVDFGPDLSGYTLQYDIHFSALKTLLITHSHYDHVFLENFNYLLHDTGTILTDPPEVSIICSQAVGDKITLHFERYEEKNLPWNIQVIKAFGTIVARNFSITALPAAHMLNREEAFFYIVHKDGKTVLLAFDTGMWAESVWRFLQNYFFDAVIAEETMGYKTYRQHLNIQEIFMLKKRLNEQKIINGNTVFIVTHISHNFNPVYSKLEEIFTPEGVQVGYDGMEVQI